MPPDTFSDKGYKYIVDVTDSVLNIQMSQLRPLDLEEKKMKKFFVKFFKGIEIVILISIILYFLVYDLLLLPGEVFVDHILGIVCYCILYMGYIFFIKNKVKK